MLPAIREADGAALGSMRWPLRDQRLVDMLFRYRARNFPDSLSAPEQQQWLAYCRARLSGEQVGVLSLGEFLASIDALLPDISVDQQQLLLSWRDYGAKLAVQLGL